MTTDRPEDPPAKRPSAASGRPAKGPKSGARPPGRPAGKRGVKGARKGGGKAGRGGDPLLRAQKPTLMGSLRSSFLAGVVVAAPIGITAAIVYWFVTGPMAKLDTFVKRWLPDIGSENIDRIVQVIPGVGVFVAMIALVMLGALAKNFFGRALINFGENILDSMPIVRNLYRFFKNVFETALQQSDRSFKEVALVEYPREGLWVMAFVVGAAKGEIPHQLEDEGDDLTCIFIPTVPNPTSGFLIFVARRALRPLDMSVEDAAKVVFSLGLVAPEFTHPDDAVKQLERVAELSRAEKPRRRFFGGGSG
ncbi:MAG: DUF502 domain-containing protein [Pseudomonadota bacterium]